MADKKLKKGLVQPKNGEILKKFLEEPTKWTPLEVMLAAMNKAMNDGNEILAADIAKKAAPFIHPTLSSVSVKPTEDPNVAKRLPVPMTLENAILLTREEAQNA